VEVTLFVYIFPPNYVTAQRGQRLRSVGLAMVIHQFLDLFKTGTGLYSQLVWSLSPDKFLLRHSFINVNMDIIYRLDSIVEGHFYTWLIAPADCSSWDLSLHLSETLTSCCLMTIDEAAMLLLWYPMAISVASVGLLFHSSV
jgi:hypothetical protein